MNLDLKPASVGCLHTSFLSSVQVMPPEDVPDWPAPVPHDCGDLVAIAPGISSCWQKSASKDADFWCLRPGIPKPKVRNWILQAQKDGVEDPLTGSPSAVGATALGAPKGSVDVRRLEVGRWFQGIVGSLRWAKSFALFFKGVEAGRVRSSKKTRMWAEES